jgi:hypothetical protein
MGIIYVGGGRVLFFCYVENVGMKETFLEYCNFQ